VSELNNYIEESQFLIPKLNEIETLLRKVKTQKDLIGRISKLKLEKDTINSFADGIISNKHDSVISQMAAIFNMVIGTPSSSGHNFIDLFIKSLEVKIEFVDLIL
jgi:hypothetical protein